MRDSQSIPSASTQVPVPGGGVPLAAEALLVEQARAGDRSAFGELVQRYEGRLFRVLNRFVRDQDLSEDLAQETFLRTYERLGQFDPSRRFGPWLFRIGVNLALDFLRRRKRRGKPALFSEGHSDKTFDPAMADPRQTIDLQQEVWIVLEQIPEKYRTALILRDLEGFSTSEIAAISGRKEATIRWRVAEARIRFQRLWARRELPASAADAMLDPLTSEPDADD